MNNSSFRAGRRVASSRPNTARRSFSRPNTNKKRPRGAFIHPSKFVNKAATPAEEVVYEAKHTFEDFPFSTALHANIAEKGYVSPSAIQDQAIPHVIEGRDVIGLANTGTGKTAAFILPIIEKLSGTTSAPAVLIMAPTRELAEQIDEQFRTFARGMRLYSALCVGGMNIDRQIRDLRRRPHVIIGTPGRLKDLLQRRVLFVKDMTTLVLDEADRMLDMGFINDIRTIIATMPKDRQTLFFSATITPTIEALVHDFLNDPVTVSVRTSETSDHVEQDVIEATSKEEKLSILTNMLSDDEYGKVLVFGETKFGVQRLSDALAKSGITSVAIHGNKTQPQRQRALRSFKNQDVRVLVATDVAARGLDIPNVSHVINFDQPATYEDYVHRIGRTGRGGAKGKAFTFIAPRYR
ncbi:MAG TPA: DEAD/DEAH box helicase [Candidatus Saccharimonadales bacterium]